MTSVSVRALTELELPLPHLKTGKVREMFAIGDEVLMVATDRLSAFDIVFDEGIPDKGRVLTQLSAFWFEHCPSATPHHCISSRFDEITQREPKLTDYRGELEGRSMLARRAEPIPVECVVRGYIDGSAWREYQESGAVTEILLPTGLERGGELPEPIFTPATKAESGHDENITYQQLESIVGADLARQLRDRSLSLYAEGKARAAMCGLILADTKFEFGWSRDDQAERLLLIDELFTPDSSRFWESSQWRPGGAQVSFDKQPVRDFLEAEREAARWDGGPPLPPLSIDAIAATTDRYRQAYQRLTDSDLAGGA